MLHGITGIDHGTIAVRDLETARTNWQRLGFTLSPIGRHTGWGTANYAMAFGNDYLALIGVVDATAPMPGRLASALDKREGMFAVALGTDDADASHASLKTTGLSPGDVIDMARDVEMPGRAEPARPRFKIIQLPESSTPGLDVSLTQHLDPDLVWRPEWQDHANSAVGIRAITIVVDNPQSLVGGYQKLFGPSSCCVADNMLGVNSGRGELFFVQRNDIAELYPGIAAGGNAGEPYILGVSLEVGAMDVTQHYLEDAGISFAISSNDSVYVDPQMANGVVLEFVISSN